MNRLISLALPLLSATVLILGPDSAQGRTVAALAGHPQGFDKEPLCLQEFYGGIVNQCTTGISWLIPLPIDSSGTLSPRITVFTNPGKRVKCNAYGVDERIYSYWTTPSVYNSTDGSSTIIPGSAFTPAGGHMLVGCQLDPGTQINNIVF